MGSRTYLTDIIAISLLYREKYLGIKSVSLEKVKELDNIINNNLITMDSSCGLFLRKKIQNDVSFYNLIKYDNNVIYAVIIDEINIEKAWEWFVYSLPEDLIKCIETEEALAIIDLSSEKIYECKKLKLTN